MKKMRCMRRMSGKFKRKPRRHQNKRPRSLQRRPRVLYHAHFLPLWSEIFIHKKRNEVETDNHVFIKYRSNRLLFNVSSKWGGGWVCYFFYQFSLKSAADILLQFLNINIRKLSLWRLAKYLCSDLFFHRVILLKLGKDGVKLVRRDFVVIQSFGEQSVDCIAFDNGERGNLLMFFFIFKSSLFAGDYLPRRNESETAPNTA